MPQMQETVRLALLGKAPALFEALAARGELNQFVRDKADEIDSLIVSRTMEIGARFGSESDSKALTERAGILKQAQILATEEVLAAMLEFPQDDAAEPLPAVSL